MPFWAAHWRRLCQGFRVLKFNLPEYYTSLFFQKEILKLIKGKGNHRIRLTIWRGGEGLYTPEKSEPVFLIESIPMDYDFFKLNNKGLHIGIYRENRLPMAKKATAEIYFLPNIKSCNSLPYILANIYKKEKKWDDVLLLNNSGRIACGGSSNVFLWKNNNIVTPPLSEGGVAGTMRSVVFDICKKKGIHILEKKVFQKDLKSADGVFLTNAISGIRWVGEMEGGHMFSQKEKAENILGEINNLIHNGYFF